MDLPLNEYWAEEWLKCAEDKYYFFENYCYLQGDGGRTLFTPREYQRRIIDAVEDNRFVVGLSGRQSGKCSGADSLVKVRLRLDEIEYSIELTMRDIHTLSKCSSKRECKEKLMELTKNDNRRNDQPVCREGSK